MNKQFIRSLEMIIAIAAMFAWLAVCWVGIKGLGSHFSWAGLAVGTFASQYIRNWANPIPKIGRAHV